MDWDELQMSDFILQLILNLSIRMFRKQLIRFKKQKKEKIWLKIPWSNTFRRSSTWGNFQRKSFKHRWMRLKMKVLLKNWLNFMSFQRNTMRLFWNQSMSKSDKVKRKARSKTLMKTYERKWWLILILTWAQFQNINEEASRISRAILKITEKCSVKIFFTMMRTNILVNTKVKSQRLNSMRICNERWTGCRILISSMTQKGIE